MRIDKSCCLLCRMLSIEDTRHALDIHNLGFCESRVRMRMSFAGGYFLRVLGNISGAHRRQGGFDQAGATGRNPERPGACGGALCAAEGCTAACKCVSDGRPAAQPPLGGEPIADDPSLMRSRHLRSVLACSERRGGLCKVLKSCLEEKACAQSDYVVLAAARSVICRIWCACVDAEGRCSGGQH